MTLLHDHDADAETHVRTMLNRLAAGATAQPPVWEDLIERQDAEVLPLDTPRSSTRTVERRHNAAVRAGVARAAAAVVLLAVAGALVVGRASSGPSDGPSAQTISVVSPGDPSFDAGAATEVWATGEADPAQAALAYLAAMGVPAGASPPTVSVQGTAGTTAVVDWSLAGAAESQGTVYLRSSQATAGGPQTWTVVGSAAPDVALADVRYDGSQLTFTVTGTTASASEQVAIAAWIDGQPVALGGDPVAWAGAADVSLGDVVELGTGAGADIAGSTFEVAAAADDVVALRVVRVVDGTVRSLTQMAVALPDAAAGAAAGTPAVDAGGHATGRADAGVDGTAGVEGEADGSGGADVAPGDIVSELPELLPLPVPLPTLPLPETPPTTVTIPGVSLPPVPSPPATSGQGTSGLLP
jgi:hypothetical protein